LFLGFLTEDESSIVIIHSPKDGENIYFNIDVIEKNNTSDLLNEHSCNYKILNSSSNDDLLCYKKNLSINLCTLDNKILSPFEIKHPRMTSIENVNNNLNLSINSSMDLSNFVQENNFNNLDNNFISEYDIKSEKHKSLFINSSSYTNNKINNTKIHDNEDVNNHINFINIMNNNLNEENNFFEKDYITFDKISKEETTNNNYNEKYFGNRIKNNQIKNNNNKALNNMVKINSTINNVILQSNFNENLDENLLKNENIIIDNKLFENTIIDCPSIDNNQKINLNIIKKVNEDQFEFNKLISNINTDKKRFPIKSHFSRKKINEIEIPVNHKKYKILIVDDHTFIRSSLKINLEKILREKNIKNIEIIEGKDGVDIINHVVKDQEENNLIK